MATNTVRIPFILVLLALLPFSACRSRKKNMKSPEVVAVPAEDSSGYKCRLDFKSAKTLSRHMKENEFQYKWVSAKANVTSLVEDKEENFDIKVSIRKDSAMLVSIQYVLGLQVAKVLLTRDSVKFVDYIHKTYFRGDFNYIGDLLNADLDYDLVQAVLFGNSADFQDEENKLKPMADRTNCKYVLSTARKKKLKKIQAGDAEPVDALQTLTLKPDNYKIETNEFIDPATSRKFIANYSAFARKDSVFAPYHVDIDILAQKKANIKIDYVRIEKDSPQKLSLNIPAKYDPIQLQKK